MYASIYVNIMTVSRLDGQVIILCSKGTKFFQYLNPFNTKLVLNVYHHISIEQKFCILSYYSEESKFYSRSHEIIVIM